MMTDQYIPELGQALYGNPTAQYSCPRYIEAGLAMLAEELTRVQCNYVDSRYRPPTENVGDVFECPVFTIRSYYWGGCLDTCDEECDPKCPTQLPNFECDGVEVSWYKYLGRGMSMNQKIEAGEWFRVIDKCMDWLERFEYEELKKAGMVL